MHCKLINEWAAAAQTRCGDALSASSLTFCVQEEVALKFYCPVIDPVIVVSLDGLGSSGDFAYFPWAGGQCSVLADLLVAPAGLKRSVIFLTHFVCAGFLPVQLCLPVASLQSVSVSVTHLSHCISSDPLEFSLFRLLFDITTGHNQY